MQDSEGLFYTYWEICQDVNGSLLWEEMEVQMTDLSPDLFFPE
jgi:hypothetical protein